MYDDPTLVAALSKFRRPFKPSRSAVDKPEAVICVATFQRPDMLRRALYSLAKQRTQAPFAIVVVDNDPTGMDGVAIANTFFSAGLLSGVCVVEEQPGNCHACNRAFREARARFKSASYILMIDDDEVADPEWLEQMITACRTKQVDIVGGPVVPHFPRNTPAAYARHPIYWPAYNQSGFVPIIYGSGNFLMRKEAFDRLSHPEFNLDFNFLGGGDTDFFTRCRKSGMSFYWQQPARIVETVPRSRVQTAWALRRGLRIGAINYRVDRTWSSSIVGRATLVAKNVALVPVSVFRSLRLLAQAEPLLVSLHPMVVAAGRILASLGFEHEQYRFAAVTPEHEPAPAE